jgi:hypothetical protein
MRTRMRVAVGVFRHLPGGWNHPKILFRFVADMLSSLGNSVRLRTGFFPELYSHSPEKDLVWRCLRVRALWLR